MFILSAIHRGFIARFWQFLFLVTFSGFIVHVAGFKGDAARTTQLVSEIRSGILDPETGFIGKNGLTDANGCVHWHYIKVEKNLAFWNSGGGGDITERLQAVIDLVLSINDTAAVHYEQTTIHSEALREVLKLTRATEDIISRKFKQLEEKHEKALQQSLLRFDSIDGQVASVAKQVNETAVIVEALRVIVTEIQTMLRAWVNPERWIASGRMLWTVGYLGYYTHGRRPTLKLLIIFVICMGLDLYHFYVNANLVADFFIRTHESHWGEWIKTAISLLLGFIVKEWGYDPQLKEMRIDTIDRNTTETRCDAAETKAMVKTLVQRSSPQPPPAYSPSAPSASDADSDSETVSLPVADSDEGKVERERPVSPLSKSPAPVTLLGASKRILWTFDENPTLKWAQS
jgi:hypothetical protein